MLRNGNKVGFGSFNNIFLISNNSINSIFTKSIFLLIKINVKYGRESFIASKIIISLSLSRRLVYSLLLKSFFSNKIKCSFLAPL